MEGFAILDKSTGEITDLKYGDKLKLIRESQINGIKKKIKKDEIQKANEVLTGESFSFFNQVTIDKLLKGELFKTSDLKSLGLVLLLSYMEINSCEILPFESLKEISDKLKVGYKQTQKIMKVATDKNIITKQNGHYVMSNKFINIGELKSKNPHVKVFHDGIKDLYYNNDISLSDIGFLFLIIPHISFYGNFLVKNPKEKAPNKMKRLNIKELSYYTKTPRATIDKIMNRLSAKFTNASEFGEMSIFAYFNNPITKNRVIIVNPLIFSRNVNEAIDNGLKYFIISR